MIEAGRILGYKGYTLSSRGRDLWAVFRENGELVSFGWQTRFSLQEAMDVVEWDLKG